MLQLLDWFVFWEGHGYLAVLIPIINFLLFSFIPLPDELFLKGFLINTGVSSYLLWIIGKRLNRNNRRRLIDPKTNEEVILKSNHSFFGVKIENWGLILGIFSVLSFITELAENGEL